MRQVLFHVGETPIYSYTVMGMLAILAIIAFCYFRLRSRGYSSVSILALAPVGAAGGIVGARLFYVVGNWEQFSRSPGTIFQFQMSGLVLYGAVVFGGTAVLLVARLLKMNVWQVADAVGIALLLGLSIGRVGCFLNGCCGGKPSGLPWAVRFPGSGMRVHPTQLYEIALNLVAFGILLYVDRRLQRDGELFFLSLSSYAVIRFSMEFLRAHADPRAALTFQLMSAGILIVSCAFLIWGRRLLPEREHGERSVDTVRSAETAGIKKSGNRDIIGTSIRTTETH